jgi:conjugal transfer pilus assembly protein TraA
MRFVRRLRLAAVALLASLFLATPALATVTTGTEFTNLFNMVDGWSRGYLGMALAIAAFLVGAIVGFAKSTAMPALIGIVFAVLFTIGPGIISGMFGAVI